MKPSILIIYTGGTIGMKPDADDRRPGTVRLQRHLRGVPDRSKRLNVGIEVFTMDPVIDSSNVSPAQLGRPGRR